jgi:hypothetical protein
LLGTTLSPIEIHPLVAEYALTAYILAQGMPEIWRRGRRLPIGTRLEVIDSLVESPEVAPEIGMKLEWEAQAEGIKLDVWVHDNSHDVHRLISGGKETNKDSPSNCE